MEIFSSYNVIIEASIIVILSFWFNSLSKKTNIPSVLMLITLGIALQYAMVYFTPEKPRFDSALEILGIIGLIMIVLEAALELELKKDKIIPITKAMGIALLGLLGSAWAAAMILHQSIPEMSMKSAWLYATPLSILSSAIIIPSVNGLDKAKKEFHIYESTFSDIMGIMMFYFLIGGLNPAEDTGFSGFSINLLVTIVIALIASYAIILIFQRIKSQAKLFLLIAVLLLLYAIGKKLHLSSLIIILIFGLVIANVKLFFPGRLGSFLKNEKVSQMYHELHIITLETAFVVRTFFFVIFGLTIAISSLFSLSVALVSILIIISIYLIRFAILRIFFGSNIMPQLFIAPRGLITVLLFYAIPKEAQVANFESGILLFVIIATSLIMTWVLIKEGKKPGVLLDDDILDNTLGEGESELPNLETPDTKPKENNPLENTVDDTDIPKE
ncbi:MAG: sodium:proton exchanger [Maribacter sp.]|nr:MAG: sodium:proton exchanger [Maribacter sp.]